jgi:nitroreductase
VEKTLTDREANNGRARQLIHERYRLDDGPALAGWNETLDVLLSHRSVRAYLPDPLPDGVLETLVAAAQSASSSSNLQAWSVISVEDPARKARLSAMAGGQKHILQAPLFLVWLADLARITAIAKEADGEVAGVSYLESFLVGAIDAALAAQNAVTALESLGLGAVYIGAIRNKPLEVAAELQTPPHVFPVFGMAVGYPDPSVDTAIRPRLPQTAVLHRECYGWGEPQRDAVASYNQTFNAYQYERAMPVQNWTAQSIKRLKDAASLSGRDRLREMLNALGFELK